ncbi:MAG: penicillin-binding protein 2 [Chloroflexota bacterium]
MTTPKIPRRIFLKGVGAILLLGGCTADLTRPTIPTTTPLPTPTPTPLPSADGVTLAYLSAWEAGDYATMYSLLTAESQSRLGQDQFIQKYNQPMNIATVQQVTNQLQSLLHDGPTASVLFRTNWQTQQFDVIEADNQMRLKFADGRWGIEWQPTLVLPQLGDNVSLAFLSQRPTRGNIYDRNLHALATQGQVVTVGVVPQLLQDQAVVIDYLATLTNVEASVITEKIAAAQPNWFVPIANIDFETNVEQDNLLNTLPGIDRRAREIRAYNDSDVASHLLGYMGAIPADQKQRFAEAGYEPDELVGLAGVEGAVEAELAGRRGGRLVTLSPSQQVLAELAAVESQAGSSVYLTIDTTFQALVERLLGERLGAVVVMDPYTGAIYAMASYPRFKPAVFTTGFDVEAWTELYSNENRPLVNRAAQGIYPPGSIFKIVTLSAGLEAIGLQPENSFVCTGKWDGLGEEFVKDCWLKTGHGKINLLDGLTQSCDVVFYEVGLALHRANPQLLPDWARSFGLGQTTDTFGLAENSGIVVDDDWKWGTYNEPLFEGDSVNAAIGQGFMLSTPIQVARLVAAVGNQGSLIRPRIIDRIVTVDGTEQLFEPEVIGTLPVSPENLGLIRTSMEAVVTGERGTARQAFQGIDYTVAGKTGTSESGQEEPHAWFAGYAPADTPRVAISVILEHAGEGSKEAAPLFRQVAEAFFEWEVSQ